MKTNKDLFERAIRTAPGGVHSPVRSFKGLKETPLFFSSAQGAYLTSVDGKKYVDFCQSFGPNLLGHRHPEVQEEVQKALDCAWTYGACEHHSLELAEWMIERIPWVDKVIFVS